MSGYDASVLNNPDTRLLVVVPNWLGDGIMAMPALQVLRDRLADGARLEVLARPGQTGLWRMHAAPDAVHTASSRLRHLAAERRDLRTQSATHAIILPHSFRSALLPALAGIPHRRGTGGQWRNLLIHDAVDLTPDADRHQQWEIARLLLPDLPATLPPPRITPPDTSLEQAQTWLESLPRPLLALIPGAARGPSKQWPSERFAAVADAWHQETDGGVCWLGTPADEALCARLAGTAPHALSLAGRTSLADFTAVLQHTDAVVANDSGGMHLAAAVGTPVVAVFGKTDPGKTGPLHPDAVVVRSVETGDRRIGRNEEAGVEALRAVSVDQVLQPVLAIAARRG